MTINVLEKDNIEMQMNVWLLYNYMVWITGYWWDWPKFTKACSEYQLLYGTCHKEYCALHYFWGLCDTRSLHQ
jgi:hypothetical protein